MSTNTNDGGADHTALKLIRKRSRVSKKKPTTLLNASAANFRALVQQFTGFQAVSSSASVQIQSQKGPVYLSFGGDSESEAASKMAEFAENSYPNHHQCLRAQMSAPPSENGFLQSSANNNNNNNVEVEEDGWLVPDYDYEEYYSLSLDSILR